MVIVMAAKNVGRLELVRKELKMTGNIFQEFWSTSPFFTLTSKASFTIVFFRCSCDNSKQTCVHASGRTTLGLCKKVRFFSNDIVS